jgi:RNA polymerase sigma-70 factor (ECF subfamily)
MTPDQGNEMLAAYTAYTGAMQQAGILRGGERLRPVETATRAPLMLQSVLGFDAATIASAFLVSPAAMGQRLVRAKAKIREARIPFRLPQPKGLADRLGSVLDAIYAAFSEGWADANQHNLSGEAIWLARVLVALLPDQLDACGLLALMLYADARRAARRDADGAYVPLAAQDTDGWDAATIAEAESLLHRAAAMGSPGRYRLEAAIQSAHVARRRSGRTDWFAIVSLYDALAAMTGSPVVAIDRAVAVAGLHGPRAGLAALDAAGSDRLADYQPYWSAHTELLARLGDRAGASGAYRRAIGQEADPAVRQFL